MNNNKLWIKLWNSSRTKMISNLFLILLAMFH